MKKTLILMAAVLLVIGCTKPEEKFMTASLALTESALTISSDAASRLITIESNTDWTITVPEGIDWIAPSAAAGTGNAAVSFAIGENTGYDDRNATVTIAAGEISVPVVITQKQKDAITVTTAKFEVSPAGETISVEVKANISYSYDILNGGDAWIHPATKGMEAKTLTFTVDKSELADKREATIMFRSGNLKEEVKVFQAGEETIVLTQNEYNVDCLGDTVVVEIAANVEYTVTMPQVDWIKELEYPVKSSNTKYYLVANNTKDVSRSAEIIFTSKSGDKSEKVTVNQALRGSILMYTVDLLHYIPSEAATLEMAIMTNVDYSLTIDGDWVTRAAATETKALRGEWLNLSVTANTSGKDRVATITLENKASSVKQVITIHQSQYAADYEIPMDANLKNYIMTNYGLSALTIGRVSELQYLTISSGSGVTSLTGLEYLKGLTEITINAAIPTIDLSKNPYIRSANINPTVVATLNASGLKKLTSLYFNDNFSSIDLSGCTSLSDYFYFDNNSNLTSLNVSGCSNIIELGCYYSALTSLNVSGCENLSRLYCYNNALTTLDVSGLKKLYYLRCDNNSLTSLNITGCANLNYLYCCNNALTTLDLSGSSILYLTCYNNSSMTSLNVSGCKNLLTLNCYRNALTTLNATGCDKLNLLSCYSNSLETLNVSGLLNLTSLYCYENSLTSLNVSGCTSLNNLQCYSNRLTTLDVTSCTALRYFDCNSNSLTALDVTKNLSLMNLYFGENSITTIDISNLSALINLGCDTNSLTSLDISSNKVLSWVNCRGNANLAKVYIYQDQDKKCDIYKDSGTVLEVKQ